MGWIFEGICIIYKELGAISGTIVVVCVGILLYLIFTRALKYLMGLLAHYGLKPKWTERSISDAHGTHMNCPRLPDVIRLIEEVKNFTETYIKIYLINRYICISDRLDRRCILIRNQVLRYTSEKTLDMISDERESVMRVARLMTQFVLEGLKSDFMASIKRNTFPLNEEEWKTYKKQQAEFIISNMCCSIRAHYPPLCYLPEEDFNGVVLSNGILEMVKSEINDLYNFAKIDLSRTKIAAEKSSVELSDLIEGVLSGTLKNSVWRIR